MKNTKAISVATILVLLWLLIGLTNISIAENIPIDKEALSEMKLDHWRLENGIGVIVFNLTTSTNRLHADGYLVVSNTYNSSIIITGQLVTKLSPVDLDENRSYRVHKKISDHIIFKPIPSRSWMTLESDTFIVNPYSVYSFRYTVDISLDSDYSFDKDEGYLMYIIIKKTIENATGANIGIAYSYKLFLVFTGDQQEQEQESAFNLWMLIPVPFVIGGAVFVVYKKKHKKTYAVTPKKTPTAHPVAVKKPSVNKPSSNHDDIQRRIDGILERDKQDIFHEGGER